MTVMATVAGVLYFVGMYLMYSMKVALYEETGEESYLYSMVTLCLLWPFITLWILIRVKFTSGDPGGEG